MVDALAIHMTAMQAGLHEMARRVEAWRQSSEARVEDVGVCVLCEDSAAPLEKLMHAVSAGSCILIRLGKTRNRNVMWYRLFGVDLVRDWANATALEGLGKVAPVTIKRASVFVTGYADLGR